MGFRNGTLLREVCGTAPICFDLLRFRNLGNGTLLREVCGTEPESGVGSAHLSKQSALCADALKLLRQRMALCFERCAEPKHILGAVPHTSRSKVAFLV